MSTSKAPANLPSGNSASLSSGTPSIQIPKNQIDVKKETEVTDKSTIMQNSETAMEKAAKAANQKAITDAKAKMQKRLAAAKNDTSIVIPNTEKQKAAQKLKEIQAENDKLNQRIKSTQGNHG
jgi:hypothetical protein